ncbi:MAG TPA: hypothetical protein VG122_18155 [Gemmata sp.]|nr:hypothetical protein [Gemmata sp.]
MPVSIELENDLSLKHQLLDVAIIVNDAGPLCCRLPDGLDNLGPHNLLTFKSFRESLDGWALDELVSYYVNYRKQVSPSMQDLLPLTDFRLYEVCVRFPDTLARETTLRPIQPGVYETRHFTGAIRVVVIHELPQEEHNALLHLFSARMDQIRYGTLNYQQRSTETSTLLRQLFQRYNLEVTLMPTGLEQLQQFAEESIEELLKELTPERRLKGLPAEERLKGLTPEQLFTALSPKEREALAQLIKDDDSSKTPPGDVKPSESN